MMRRLLAPLLCLFASLVQAQVQSVIPSQTVLGNTSASAAAPSAKVISTLPVTVTGSTTARTLSARAADIVNVKDYGVVCDGSTDNSSAFTLVTNAAVSGSTIFFPPATASCLTSAPLAPKSGVTIFAFPNTVTLAPTSGSTASPVLFTTSTKTGILVYGLTFDGGGKDFAGGSGSVVQSYRDTGLTFDRITVQNTRGIGVLFSGSTASGVINSTFNNIGNHWITTGVSTDRAQGIAFCCTGTFPISDVFVINNFMTNVGLDAISMGSTTNATVTNNRCEMADFNQLTTLTAGAYSACVWASQMKGGIIANNNSVLASGNAYDTSFMDHVTISGNVAISSGSAGIGLFANTNVSVTGNTLLNNNQGGTTPGTTFKAGIALSNGDSNISISGNVSTDTQTTKTQTYGFQAITGYTYTNIFIDQSNVFNGNLTAQFSGPINDFTLAHTGSGAFMNAYGASPNGSMALQYAGTGEVDIADPVGFTRLKANASVIDSGVTGSVGANFRVNAAVTNLINTDLTTYSFQSPGNTITNNAAVAPNGNTTATAMLTVATLINQYRYRSATAVSGVLYTLSAYFQAIPSSTQNIAGLYISGTPFGGTSLLWGANINVQTCAFTGYPNSSSAPTSFSVTPMAHGWCKLSVSQRATSSGSYTPTVYNASSAGQVAFTGDGTGVYVYGMDLESNTESFYTAKGAVAGSAPILSSSVAPTISSGFGTSPTIPSNQGTVSFTVNVGTGGSATSGVIGMPAAPVGWVCQVHDVTNGATNLTDQTGSTTSTVTLTNFLRSSGAASAWPASDILQVGCLAN